MFSINKPVKAEQGPGLPSTPEAFLKWVDFDSINKRTREVMAAHGAVTFPKPITRKHVYLDRSKRSDLEEATHDQNHGQTNINAKTGEPFDVVMDWTLFEIAGERLNVPPAVLAMTSLVHESVHWYANVDIKKQGGGIGREGHYEEQNGLTHVEVHERPVGLMQREEKKVMRGYSFNEALTERVAVPLALAYAREHLAHIPNVEQAILSFSKGTYVSEQALASEFVAEVAQAEGVDVAVIWKRILGQNASRPVNGRDFLDALVATPRLSERGKLFGRAICDAPDYRAEETEQLLSDEGYLRARERVGTLEYADEFARILAEIG